MSGQMNGAKLEGLDAEDQQQEPIAPNETAAKKARGVLDAQIRQVLDVTIRGLLVSAPGVPPHEVLNSIARVTGGLVAGAIQADLQTLLKMRKGLKDAFDDGVKQAPLLQPMATGPQPARPR